MTVKLTTEEKNSQNEACNDLLLLKTQSIRRVAQLIGIIVSSLPGVKYGGSHYRNLEWEKISAIKSNKGSFDDKIKLSERVCSDLQQWYTNIPNSCNEITKCTSSLTTKTDACETGWGAVCKGMRTGSQFSLNQQQLYINVLELLAAFFGLKAFVKNSDTHVKILSDNTAIVYSINKMGSNNPNTCHKVICDVQDWAEQNSIWITATHIRRKYHQEADK